MVNASKPSAKRRFKPSLGYSGATNHAGTQSPNTAVRYSSNSSGKVARTHLPVETGKRRNFLNSRTINIYEVRYHILRPDVNRFGCQS